jgi:hypothetical protein
MLVRKTAEPATGHLLYGNAPLAIKGAAAQAVVAPQLVAIYHGLYGKVLASGISKNIG